MFVMCVCDVCGACDVCDMYDVLRPFDAVACFLGIRGRW